MIGEYYKIVNGELVRTNEIEYPWITGKCLYKFKTITFESNVEPTCNGCGSGFKFLIRNKKQKYIKILDCLNNNCESKITNKNTNKYKTFFLPKNIIDDLCEKHKQHNVYNIDYLRSLGLSNEEINNKIQTLKNKCAENGKKNKGKSWKIAILNKYGEEIAEQKIKEHSRLNIEYWVKHGYSVENAKNEISNLQSKYSKCVKIHNGLSKQYLINNGYSVEEANLFMKQKSIRCKEYWIKRGYSEEDAIKKVSEVQSNYGKKQIYNPETNSKCKEYWIKRGYSEEDAKQIISNNQKTFSKEKCIEKYGYELGIEKWCERQEKWINSLHKNKNLNSGFSKISQELFDNIIKIYNYENEEIYYANRNKEYPLRFENKIYFYDFINLTKKKIIEFNGDVFHANPKQYKETDNPSPFNETLTAKEVWEHDAHKQEIANKLGFSVYVVWESDYKENKEKIINDCINFLNNE